MKVLVDTNVILDVLLKRDGLYAESFEIFQLVEQYSASVSLGMGFSYACFEYIPALSPGQHQL
jgi:predicted nucleic acid-binding protein